MGGTADEDSGEEENVVGYGRERKWVGQFKGRWKGRWGDSISSRWLVSSQHHFRRGIFVPNSDVGDRAWGTSLGPSIFPPRQAENRRLRDTHLILCSGVCLQFTHTLGQNPIRLTL